MLRLWLMCRPQPGMIGGMAAGWVPVTGHLPESGGVGDQAAIMLDALDIMDAAAAQLRPKPGG